jgi:hypothetical protein
MVKKQKTQKPLIAGENQLLSVKALLDQVLQEVENLNPDVKDLIVNARDAAWDQFVKEQESNMPGRNIIN